MQDRQGGIEVGLFTADHEGQGAGGGAAGTAGYRRVDHGVTVFCRGVGHFAGAHGIDGGAVDQANRWGNIGQQAFFTQIDGLHMLSSRKHGDDQFDIAFGQLGNAGRGAGASFHQVGYGCLGQVEYSQLVAGLDEVMSHRPTHVA